MRGKRTDTYYVYDAYTDELVGCGSLAKISELFEITPRTLKKICREWQSIRVT